MLVKKNIYIYIYIKQGVKTSKRRMKPKQKEHQETFDCHKNGFEECRCFERKNPFLACELLMVNMIGPNWRKDVFAQQWRLSLFY